jgi:hypothetical protein
LPAAHVPHCESDPEVHVGAELHCAIAVQAEQTRSAVVVQAAAWYCPTAQAPEQGTHAPLLRNLPDAQLVHCVAPGPEQVPQLASQAEHTRSAFAEHAALWY